MNQKEDWFESWFDSPYYHHLYSHRNPDEARSFLESFQKKENMLPGGKVLDLACGTGRHTRTLSSMGFDTYGIDLSANNIEIAKSLTSSTVHFSVADMRSFKLPVKFDFIFNLFTSFGYFDDPNQNYAVLANCREHLNTTGRMVIDYFNSHLVIQSLVSKESIQRDLLQYEVTRYVTDSAVIKEIRVTDKGVKHSFMEKVGLLDLDQFAVLAKKTGFKILRTYGTYSLQPFSRESSERLILVLEKA